MTIEITSRHFTLSPQLQSLIHEKVGKIEKYSKLTSCNVILEKDNTGEVVEIKAHSKGREFFAQDNSPIFEKSLTLVVDKIIIQLKKYTDKINGKGRNNDKIENLDLELPED